MAELNYFVTTLGQAEHLHKNGLCERLEDVATITAFIDTQADRVPLNPACGFVDPGHEAGQPSTILFTYSQLQLGSSLAAERLSHLVSDKAASVALLSRSTPDLLFTWLGLLRLGCSVVLIAPQCQPPAIAHLCETCRVSRLVYDEHYEKLARDAALSSLKEKSREVSVTSMPYSVESVEFRDAMAKHTATTPVDQPRNNDTAYYFHTSGTSTGLPKPIPQSHRGAVSVLPRMPHGARHATFTTTPLFHGGVSDCLRAWSSDALIWLFWNKDRPITAPNVCKCFDAIAEEHHDASSVGYFSSVPYILQLMASSDAGLSHLQRMELVGVGGAALPVETGNDLVAKGVNLVSRYGSAECGFLLSSHREYSTDDEWRYLRSEIGCSSLRFESRDEGLFELVVLPEWPHRAKTNREDGSFATSDLFEPHPSIPKAWRYHSRADSQITLVTGKKFDPAPLESSLATSLLLDDVLIFGDDRPYPGALLFRSEKAKEVSDEDLINELGSFIDSLNEQSSDHARLAKHALQPLPFGQNKLQKSSKGTLLRNKAVEAYASEIDHVYADRSSALVPPVADNDVLAYLQAHIQRTLKGQEKPTPDQDLFSYGITSLVSIHLRTIARALISQQSSGQKEPSMTLIEDCGTPARLARYIIDVRHGRDPCQGENDDLELMLNLVEHYSDFAPPDGFGCGQASLSTTPCPARHTIILTGATGTLGSHLLDKYRHSPHVEQIYLFVRAATTDAAIARIEKGLAGRNLSPLSSPAPAQVEIIPARLSETFLGLSKPTYAKLATTVTLIVHAAWAVNFRLRLRSFRDHLAATRNLLALALHSSHQARMAFASSVASVSSFQPASTSSGPEICVPEAPSITPGDASPLGYAQSKWVAERLCRRAAESAPGRISVLRIGQLAGDCKSGVWNASEAWPLMLASSKNVHCLPRLRDTVLDWLPVDVAARIILDLTLLVQTGEECAVYHVLNDARPAREWAKMLEWIEEFSSGGTLSVEPKEYFEKLEELKDKGVDDGAVKLLGMWREAYGQELKEESKRVFGSSKAREASPVFRGEVAVVEKEYFEKLWAWIRDSV